MMAQSKQSLCNQTRDSLRTLCKEKGLPVCGLKYQLVERLCEQSDQLAPPKKRAKTDHKNSKSIVIVDKTDEIEDIDIMESIDNANNSIDDNNNNTIIRLNVGGVKFVTTLQTLLKKQESNHLLAKTFAKYTTSSSMNSKEHFFDRDGSYFGHILNFLRDSDSFRSQILPQLPNYEMIHLREESKYFGLYNDIFDLDTDENDCEPIDWDVAFCVGNGNTATSRTCYLNENTNGLITQTVPKAFIDNEKVVSFVVAISIEVQTVLCFGIVDNVNFSKDSRIVKIEKSYQPCKMIGESICLDFKHGIFEIGVNPIKSKPFNVSKNCLRIAIWKQDQNRSRVCIKVLPIR